MVIFSDMTRPSLQKVCIISLVLNLIEQNLQLGEF